MSEVFIISSFVAASRVGGFAQSLALTALGHEVRLAPTVLFGRHPGLGAPGGAPVDAELFKGVLQGAEAAGALNADAILIGYFAAAAQVEAAAAVIERARLSPRPPLILLDPIFGDADVGRYVRPGVEEAVIERLVPLADRLAPNLFELSRLTGAPLASTIEAALDQGRALERPVAVTSAPCGPGRLGVIDLDPQGTWLATHAAAPSAPRGVGDLFKALYLHGLLQGRRPGPRLFEALCGVLSSLEAARSGGGELTLAGLGARLSIAPPDLVMTELHPGERP